MTIGADGDAGVHVAVVADVAHGAGIGAAALAFQFLDDLHGPDLGRAADGAGREGGAQQVVGVHALAQRPCTSLTMCITWL
jgi:hypothetical protein